MIIVAGHLIIRTGERERFLSASLEPMKVARRTQGCREFVVAADPLIADRVNVFEEWESEELLHAFRESGPEDSMIDLVVNANVREHRV